MPGWARPVRIFCSSALNDSTERAIFCSAVFLMSAIVIAGPSSHVDERAFVLAFDDALERAGLEDGKHPDRQLLVAAEGERGGVEHLQVLDDRLVEADPLVAYRARVLVRVGVVDAVDLGRLEDDLRPDLGPAQRRRG